MKMAVKSLACILLCVLMILQLAACQTKPSEGSSEVTGDTGSASTGSDDFWADPTVSEDPAMGTESSPAGTEQFSSQGQTPGNTTSKAPAVIRPVEVDTFKFPTYKFANKTMKLLTANVPNKKYTEKLKSQYGITTEMITVAWADLPLKLTAMVLSDGSPDMVEYRSDNTDLPSFIIKNLIQPINPYVNINDGMYSHLKEYYKRTSWGGNNYLMITDYTKGSVLYYNTKMFKDYGVEDPWTLYKQGKWDWNKFAEVSAEFKDDTNKDGKQDRFGFALGVPSTLMIYTTGEAFGSFDGANKKVINNVKSANVARCMNFMHDLIFEKGAGNNTMATASPLFKSGIIAMYFGDPYYYTEASVTYLAKKNQLGIVPLPRDPKADKLHYYLRLGGYFIAKGAKNPNAVAAFGAVSQYFTQSKEENENFKKELKGLGYSDLNIQQMNENWNSGSAVLELTPFIGYYSVWMSFQNQVAWATQLAQDETTINNTLDEIYEDEVEAPTGPKVVDNFEKYGTSTTTPLSKWVAEAGGSPNIKMYLDSKNPHEGKYSARIDYSIAGTETEKEAGITKSFSSTWATNNTLTFWAKGDGKGDQVVTVQIRDANGTPFAAQVTLTGTGKNYSIKFSDFKIPEWYPDKTPQLNIDSMSGITLLFSGKASNRSIYIDLIEAVKK